MKSSCNVCDSVAGLPGIGAGGPLQDSVHNLSRITLYPNSESTLPQTVLISGPMKSGFAALYGMAEMPWSPPDLGSVPLCYLLAGRTWRSYSRPSYSYFLINNLHNKANFPELLRGFRKVNWRSLV